MARPMRASGKRRSVPALCGPPSSEDEAPEEVTFGAAKEAADTERKLVGEAARRHQQLLKEKRRRRQELFAEQKRQKLLPEAVLQELAAAPPARPRGAAAAERGKGCGAGAVKQSQGVKKAQQRQGVKKTQQRQGVKKTQKRGARSKGNYTAVCLKDQHLPGLHQQLAQDFLTTQLYGPHANRAQPNDFFSLENKKNPVKKAAVQFVDKSWGQEKKERATRFKKLWLAKQLKSYLHLQRKAVS